MSSDANEIKIGDKSLSEVLNVLSAQLERLETKVDNQQQANNEHLTNPPFSTGDTAGTNAVPLQQGPGPNTTTLGSASPPEFDIQKKFDSLKDSLAKIQLPPECKVNESQQGIKSDCKPPLKIITKTARFAETGLKLISQLNTQNPDSELYTLTATDIEKLYIIFQAQINYLQSEYSGLVVRSTFDEETSRLFRAFQNNSQAFSERSLNNVRLAAELTSISSRHSRGSSSRGFRGNSSYRRSFGNRGGPRTSRGFHPPDVTSTFPGSEQGSG